MAFEASSVEYHCANSCNKCASVNEVTATGFEDGYMTECSTVCKKCEHVDCWSYGFFESGERMQRRCKTYKTNPTE